MIHDWQDKRKSGFAFGGWGFPCLSPCIQQAKYYYLKLVDELTSEIPQNKKCVHSIGCIQNHGCETPVKTYHIFQID